MRIIAFLAAGLTFGALAIPAQADPRETDFVSMHQCENFLNRWRNSLERPPTADALAYLRPRFAGAYCVQSANGRYNVVWPS